MMQFKFQMNRKCCNFDMLDVTIVLQNNVYVECYL